MMTSSANIWALILTFAGLVALQSCHGSDPVEHQDTVGTDQQETSPLLEVTLPNEDEYPRRGQKGFVLTGPCEDPDTRIYSYTEVVQFDIVSEDAGEAIAPVMVTINEARQEIEVCHRRRTTTAPPCVYSSQRCPGTVCNFVGREFEFELVVNGDGELTWTDVASDESGEFTAATPMRTCIEEAISGRDPSVGDAGSVFRLSARVLCEAVELRPEQMSGRCFYERDTAPPNQYGGLPPTEPFP